MFESQNCYTSQKRVSQDKFASLCDKIGKPNRLIMSHRQGNVQSP